MKILIPKIILIAIYLVALAGLVGWVSPSTGQTAINISAVLIGIHVIELLLVFKYVKLYSGGLALSIVLTLLFGLLHWKPIINAQRKQA